MLFPSACLTKHRNPSSAFKFAGFCDVAQFLGWLACNLNLQFRIITFYQEEVEEGKGVYEDEEEEEEDVY